MSQSSPEPVSPVPAAHPPRPAWLRLLRVLLYAVLGLWTLLLAAWLTLHWGLLPRVDEWRPDIERHASAALGAPVHIGSIQVSSNHWIPVFDLRDVRLDDPRGRPALRLPRVVAALSPRSLLAFELRLSQLYLDAPELVVRRDGDGRLHVAGQDLDAEGTVGGQAAADWLLAQHEVLVQHGRVLWIDETRQPVQPLPLEDVQFVLRNSLRQHHARLDATPPPAWGDRFSLRGRFRQPLLDAPSHWQHWTGTLYAEWPRVESAALASALQLPLRAEGGEGAVRAWFDLRQGLWQRATADVAFGALALRLSPRLEPLALSRLSSRLEAERRADGWRLAARDLAFATPEGHDWPASRLELAWQHAPQPAARPASFGLDTEAVAAPVTGGELSADRLDLAVLADLAERLPLPAGWRRQLAELEPAGQLEQLQARWSGPPDAPQRYRLKGRARDLSLRALPSPEPGGIGRPGARGLNLSLDADERGGQADVELRDGALGLPGVFAEPEVPLESLHGRLLWTVRPVRGQADAPPQVELRLQDARFANADARGEMQLQWQTGPGAAGSFGRGQRLPGRLELTGQLTQARAAAVARYLPLGLGTAARGYVAEAVREGVVPKANFRVRGDLWDFPFASGQEGEFHLAAQVQQLTLDYVPARLAGDGMVWPPFTQVAGELVFDRGSMAIRQARARLWGVELQGVNGRIDDLVHHPELRIEGAGRGPLTDALRFVAASPVAGWTRQALSEAAGTGSADLKLALRIPLDDAGRSTVKGSVQLAGNELRLRPEVPPLSGARARIDFSESGFAIVGGRARALGGEAQIEGASRPDGSVWVKVQGQASAEGLRQATELGALTRLGQLASGSTAYQLQLGFLRGRMELGFQSTLQGLAVDLPAPLRKAAAEAWPLKVQTTLGPEGGAHASRDTLRVDLAAIGHAEYQREYHGDQARVLRGALALGDALPALPARGVLAQLRLGKVDAADWLAAAQRPAPAGAAPGGTEDGYLPTDIQLSAQSLALPRLTLGPLTAQASPRGGGWRVQLQSEQAAGQVDWQPGANAQQPAQVEARLSRLVIPASPSDPTSARPTAPTAAPRPGASSAPVGPLPALDIQVGDLRWGERALGRLELDTTGAAAGAREWRIQRLALVRPEARLQASGAWSAAPQPHLALDLALQVSDGGELLQQWGLGRVLRGGKGELRGRLGWKGSPLEPPGLQLDGDLHLALGEGQILKVEPGGAGRLLGVMSLQSLPRRLTLDFRDVFQEGFSFDDLTGDIRLAGGVAHTTNLRLRGVQAAVLLEGQADLLRETQDLHLVVVPEINAGTASLAYAAINPVIGLGTFLAQYLLRQPLQQAGTREFRVHGPWEKPQVDPVERRAAPAAAASDAAAR
jgi:uncharacterized protein (TIGR02099 family)